MKLIMVLHNFYFEIKEKDEAPICGPSTMEINSKNGILFCTHKISQQRDPGGSLNHTNESILIMEDSLDCL